MIKKHLIACSVLLGIILITKMFIYSSTKTQQILPVTNVVSKIEEPTKNNYYQTLNFAHESLPVEDAKVSWLIKSMLKKHSYDNLQTNRLHQKASQWFPIIEPILKVYNIPLDFKYMPLVESGLASGTSPKGASGYWQFMPQTARNYGLKVNGTVDERQSMQKSTIAAAKYLRSLYKEFNNWTLVAAAYNTGETNLHRQISRQKTKNYFKMKLNRETASYVYKLVSMKEIIERPKKYGFTAGYTQKWARLAHPKVKRVDFQNVTADNDLLEMQTFTL